MTKPDRILRQRELVRDEARLKELEGCCLFCSLPLMGKSTPFETLSSPLGHTSSFAMRTDASFTGSRPSRSEAAA